MYLTGYDTALIEIPEFTGNNTNPIGKMTQTKPESISLTASGKERKKERTDACSRVRGDEQNRAALSDFGGTMRYCWKPHCMAWAWEKIEGVE